MASYHTWVALLLAAGFVAQGASRWHYALHQGPRYVLQLVASVLVYGLLTFLVLRLFALPFFLMRKLRGKSGSLLRCLEAGLPIALVAWGMVTLDLAVAWNLDLPQLVPLTDPVRMQLAYKATAIGVGAGLAAGLLMLFFAPKVDAEGQLPRASLVGRMSPWLLLLLGSGLVATYANSLDAGSLRATQETKREELLGQRRLAIFCMDAAMWRLVDRYIEEGRMPVTEALLEEGVRGHLITWGQRLSPVVWTSMVTGMAEEKHGIHGFTELVDGSRTPALTRSSSRKAAALWNVTRAANTSTLVLNWLVTDPPEPTVGVVIPSLKPTLAGIAPATYPAALREGLQTIVDNRQRAEPIDDGKMPAQRHDVVEEELHLLGTLQQVYGMAAALDDYALVVTGTQTTDGVMHQRMRQAFPEDYDAERWGAPGEDQAQGAEDLALAYEGADEYLGQLVDDGYTILIVSDHGSRAQRHPMVTFSLNALLDDMGLAMPGEPGPDGRRHVDTEKSRAFEAGNNALTSEIGLFFQEEVTDGVASTSLQELLTQLRGLHVEGEDAPLFEGVVDLQRKPAFPLLRDQGAAAAVVLGSALRQLPLQRQVVVNGTTHPLSRYVNVLEGMSGTHDPHGLFLLAGPDVAGRGAVDSLCVETSFGTLLTWVIGAKPIATPLWEVARAVGLVPPYTTLDIAPTALAFLGLPVAEDMDGKIMAAALDGIPYPKRALKTFAPLLVPVEPGQGVDEAADEAVMELLRGLGYVR